uniref:RRM domain-containing protein n=1 Tax=Lotus japonicus TaxID=34305 RepID=I3T885_LOTJA|nr:unknown [Lotus japonicus]
MAALESSLSVFAPQRFSTIHLFPAKPPEFVKLHASLSHSHNLLFSSNASSKTPKPCTQLCSALQEVAEAATEEEPEQDQQATYIKKKLYVFNLPWSMSAADIKDLFGQCGTVTDVEIIRGKDGRGKGYAFVTMASGEEAQAAVDKFDTLELSGRILRVELAKRFKKPSPPGPPSPPPSEARHVIYASNLAWKVRSTHLREFFTENFKAPLSARIVFDTPSGKTTGYGFISYLTKEEAEAAISALDGKELMGRSLFLKISEKKVKEAGSEKDEDLDQGHDAPTEES